ncbi:uncharacterized protein LOC123549602, partial [Mercenaria mercenaria]|uniref:uncharacterized protein LOC123549602 n=1 Tax=Mercenaria mercenaria TaxID=6596 RepID=UPI00234F1203
MSGKREDKQPIVVELHDNNQATDNPGGTFKDESESKEGMKPTGEESSIEETQNMDQDKTFEAGTSASGHTESPPHDKSCEAEIPASGHTESPPHDEGSISARTVTGRKTACLMRCLIWILRYPCTCSKQKVSINFIGALWMGFDLIKIILVSIYVCKVAEHRGRFSVLVNHGHVTLRHMLLRGWDASFETLPYPPAHGEFAVYNVEDLVKSIDYTVQQLYNAEVAATGNFMKLRKDDIIIAFTYFNVTENKSKQTFSNLKIKGSSVSPKYGLTNRTDARGQPVYDYNIHSELIAENLDSIFQTVLSVKISFSLHSLKVYDEQDRKGQATCLQINGT